MESENKLPETPNMAFLQIIIKKKVQKAPSKLLSCLHLIYFKYLQYVVFYELLKYKSGLQAKGFLDGDPECITRRKMAVLNQKGIKKGHGRRRQQAVISLLFLMLFCVLDFFSVPLQLTISITFFCEHPAEARAMTSPWQAALAETALDCASNKKQTNKPFLYCQSKMLLLLAVMKNAF